jgi:hypothetical protein
MEKDTTRFNTYISNYHVNNNNQVLTVKKVTNATVERMPMARDLSSITTITHLARDIQCTNLVTPVLKNM